MKNKIDTAENHVLFPLLLIIKAYYICPVFSPQYALPILHNSSQLCLHFFPAEVY